MTPDQYSALQRLADVPRGIAKTLMLAHGFTHELIAGLVLADLATVVTDTARIGEQTIEVELVIITDAGRRVIEAEQTSGRKPPEGSGLYLAKLRSVMSSLDHEGAPAGPVMKRGGGF